MFCQRCLMSTNQAARENAFHVSVMTCKYQRRGTLTGLSVDVSTSCNESPSYVEMAVARSHHQRSLAMFCSHRVHLDVVGVVFREVSSRQNGVSAANAVVASGHVQHGAWHQHARTYAHAHTRADIVSLLRMIDVLVLSTPGAPP